MAKNKLSISVFIPVYNGEKYIQECISSVLAQKLPDGYGLEVIVFDSGSSDKSVEIIKQFDKKITFLEIPNDEFGHGKTREKAARMAKGKYILFLTQDATPSHDYWLINMIEPFFISDRVGCVFGRQIPRPFSVPTIKREVATVFGNFGPADSIILHRHKSLVDTHRINDLNSFFSDANSAVRRDLLIKEVPFRDLPYAEDQALAQDMQEAGYIKAYTPAGSVWHSNEYTAREFYHRKFDEYIGLQESVGYVFAPRLRSLVLGWVKPTLDDIRFTLREGEYNRRAKLKFILSCPFYNIAEKRARHDAFKYFNDDKKRATLSLESRQKNK